MVGLLVFSVSVLSKNSACVNIYSHVLKNVNPFLQSLFCLDFACELILSVSDVAAHI